MTKKDITKEVYSMKEVASILGVSLKTAYYGATQGDFPAFKVLGKWIIPKESMKRLLSGDLKMEFPNDNKKDGK